MKLRSRSILAGSLALTATINAASGGVTESPVIESPPPASPWQFEASIYGWLTSIDGTTGVEPLTADVDASFSDIFDQIKMVAALRFEARNGRWGIIADGFYADLGGSGNPRAQLYDYVDLDVKEFLGELSVAYRLYESPAGFVDVYAGIRYNSLKVEFSGNPDSAGIQSISDNTSARLVNRMEQRADAIAEPKAEAYEAASAAERAAIEADLTAEITAEADEQVKRDLAKRLNQIRRDNGLDAREFEANKFTRALKAQRAELAAATAELEVAQLRASVDATLQADVDKAQARIRKSEKELAAGINKQLANRLPTNLSDREDWVDPIVGMRAQWNINEKWFLAASGDIGGFSVGSDFAWSVQATVGYNFNERYSLELGYRYLDTDYTNDKFVYDVANGGIYTSLNIKF
ncbi:MAG: hypothetical protein V4819_13995 [Verrucomicrobiota bacterium]